MSLFRNSLNIIQHGEAFTVNGTRRVVSSHSGVNERARSGFAAEGAIGWWVRTEAG